jgi:4-carboxymuconolactone decarboxylase
MFGEREERSMARVPVPTRESVPENQRPAYDEIIRERGGPVQSGPGSVLLNSPEMARRANHLSAYLRRESTLPAKVQELAMLTTARELDCQYIWNAHAASGRRAGLSDALVDALRDKRDLPPLAADEAAVVNLGQEFFRTHRVSDATFQAALQQFGPQGLTELVTLMGYYGLLAFNANTFAIDLPSERPEAVLPV